MTTSELMEAMAKAGAPFEAILIAIRALEAKDADIAQREADAAAKRAKEAARKKEKRGKSVECPQNVQGQSTDIDGDISDQEAAPSLSLPPNENISNPLTHTYPDIIPARESQADLASAVGEFEPDRPAHFGPDDVQAMWNLAAKQMDLPKAVSMSDTRRKHAQALIRKHGRDGFTEAIAAIERSAFLRGENDRGWKADIDFLLQTKSFLKLIEGSYDRSSRAKSRAKYEPEGAIAHLHHRLGNPGNHETSGSPGPSDDGWSGGGDFLPYS